MGCPAICRDEIKEGMVHATPGFSPAPGDELTRRTFTTFFEILELLLRAGATTVAEAAFQDHLWRPHLERFRTLANIRIIECVVDEEIARARQSDRDQQSTIRRAHVAGWYPTDFTWISLRVPRFRVDTSGGYAPPLSEIVSFAAQQSFLV